MAGTLYVVATPIGNLQDMTPRAAATFGSVDFIAAEDTRVTLKLLNHLGLKKPMVSYYEHNAAERGTLIIDRILAGENCAVCSDAGMPCISDPGELLVKDAHAAGITVVPIPAASASATALAVSGQATGRWCFEGFLPMNKNQRRERLAELQNEQRTMIFYEAPHKLNATLADLAAAFGGDRSISICRELTKLHEEIFKTTLAEAVEKYKETPPKGEFCLVVAGAEPKPAEEKALTLADAVKLAQELIADGKAPSAACKEAARLTGRAKGEIYTAYLAAKEEEEE
jgi:16S rRNA (cytidine1402-2'-O)-methyltransferase